MSGRDTGRAAREAARQTGGRGSEGAATGEAAGERREGKGGPSRARSQQRARAGGLLLHRKAAVRRGKDQRALSGQRIGPGVGTLARGVFSRGKSVSAGVGFFPWPRQCFHGIMKKSVSLSSVLLVN
ncbi:hypothetical protein TYRP_023232 [Tyrophagus putrescentiae]|nr:hypothetical protein TYRP_023232 [Tyrophagus putrescentiae]